MSNTYLDQQVFIIHLLACPRKKPDMAWIGHLLHGIPRAAAVQIRVSGIVVWATYSSMNIQSLVGLPSIKARINHPSRALTSMLGKQACCSCSATVFCTTSTIGHFHEILSHKNFSTRSGLLRDLSRDDCIEEFIKRIWSSGLVWAVGLQSGLQWLKNSQMH